MHGPKVNKFSSKPLAIVLLELVSAGYSNYCLFAFDICFTLRLVLEKYVGAVWFVRAGQSEIFMDGDLRYNSKQPTSPYTTNSPLFLYLCHLKKSASGTSVNEGYNLSSFSTVKHYEHTRVSEVNGHVRQ